MDLEKRSVFTAERGHSCPQQRVLGQPASKSMAPCRLKAPADRNVRAPLNTYEKSALKHSYDVVIVGGGPAGTATGHYLAKQGLSVAILERTAYENWRVGETLPPHAQIELARLGVWPRFLSQKFVASLELRWSWGAAALVEHNFLLNPYGPVWHVDRQKFDLMLLGQARESGADIAQRAVVRSVRPDSGRWRLDIFHAGKETTLHCSFLVDATGQSAFIARALWTKRLRFVSNRKAPSAGVLFDGTHDRAKQNVGSGFPGEAKQHEVELLAVHVPDRPVRIEQEVMLDERGVGPTPAHFQRRDEFLLKEPGPHAEAGEFDLGVWGKGFANPPILVGSALEDGNVQPLFRQVMPGRRSGRTAADDDHVIRMLERAFFVCV